MPSNKDKARRFAVEAVCRAAFHNRKGHGGAVGITRRVLTPEQLQSELHHAISRYSDALRYFESLERRGAQPPRPKGWTPAQTVHRKRQAQWYADILNCAGYRFRLEEEAQAIDFERSSA